MLASRLLILTLIFAGPPAQTRSTDRAEVVAAIEAGKRALLERISECHEIEYRSSDLPFQTTTVRGTVTQNQRGIITLKRLNGGTVKIPHRTIVHWATPGHVHPEMGDHHYSGPSTLVAMALISAGVKTTHPTMAMLLDALSKDDTREAGTYVHSLRATVWSALLDRPISRAHRARYRKLLQEDMTWLMRAVKPGGGYDYTPDIDLRWDNSNTQFANLGLWAGAVGGVEVADKVWLTMGRHWLNTQTPSGGWTYSESSMNPSASMTVAGCNSLYIVLDRFYARAEGRYVLLKGAPPKMKIRREMQMIRRAIDGGDAFLQLHPPDVKQFNGYELFGLERLGLASGRAVIGGKDWFRHHVDAVTDHAWGSNPIADAFALIFLVHGEAPVLMQKLEHGLSADDWNYYHRDLYSLTRHLSKTFERLYRWQRIPVDAGLHEMQDAPILYISGRGELDLPDETRTRIRQYVDRGGTVFLHADRAGKTFIKSATTVFEQMFRDHDRRFKKLKESHALYTCHFDCRPKKRSKRVPLRAIMDGPRILVLLCPVDIAGAWHQECQAKHEHLFQLMANARVYVAPPYSELPTRLRGANPRIGKPAPARGSLSLKRLPHSGHWDAHPGAWRRFAEGLRHRAGIDLTVQANDAPLDEKALKHTDVIHLTTRRSLRLDNNALAILRATLEGGGLLIIDAADGQPAGITAVRELVSAIGVGTRGVLSADHRIATGLMLGGQPLVNLQTTRAGSSLTRGNTPPPILTRTIDGRVAVIACPFDIIAGVDGHFVWNRSGYRPSSTARIIDNIFLWRLDQINARRRPTP